MQDSRIRHGYKERSDHMICLFPFFKIKSFFFFKFFKDFELTVWALYNINLKSTCQPFLRFEKPLNPKI